MTIATSTARADYAGDGVSTVFTVPFYFLDATHLEVVKRGTDGAETVLVKDVHYTVAGAAVPAGGTITMLAAPAGDVRLTIRRKVPITQTLDYVANDPFPADSHERGLDKAAMIDQQQAEEISRSVRAPVTDPAMPPLPSRMERAGKYQAYGAGGEPIAVDGAGPPFMLDGAGQVTDDPAALDAITNKLRYRPTWTGSRSRPLSERLSNMLVLDDAFGADNTGFSDSSAAVERAIEAAMRRAVMAGNPGAGYFDIILDGMYRIDSQIDIPGEAFVRFIGQGGKYYSAGFLQGFDGDMFTCTSGNNVAQFRSVLFQGDKDEYDGDCAGFRTAQDSVHAEFRDCTFRDWGGVGLDLANCFDCDFDGLLLPYNKLGGWRVGGGASNRLGRVCAQNNLGFDIDLACVGSSGGPFFLEGGLIDNDPAGENLSNRALILRGSDNTIIGGTLLVNANNNKTPVEITGERNAWLAVSAAGKGTATHWVTFGSGANHCRLGGGLQTALTGDAAAVATCLGELAGAYYVLPNGEVLFSKGSPSLQAGKGLHIGFDPDGDRAYIASSDPGNANHLIEISGSAILLTGNLRSAATATSGVSTPATVNRRLPIYNEVGSLIGYVPIFTTL